MLINDQIEAKLVPNPLTHLPSISTNDMVELMRIDKTKGAPRIASHIESAYDIINRQIPTSCKSLLSWQSLIIITEISSGRQNHDFKFDRGEFERAYRRAVLHEAAALMSDGNISYDTTAQGTIRAESQLTESGRYRRIVNHAVADMRGIRRNRVKLL